MGQIHIYDQIVSYVTMVLWVRLGFLPLETYAKIFRYEMI